MLPTFAPLFAMRGGSRDAQKYSHECPLHYFVGAHARRKAFSKWNAACTFRVFLLVGQHFLGRVVCVVGAGPSGKIALSVRYKIVWERKKMATI